MAQLAETGEVSESTEFGGGAKFIYRLISDSRERQVSADFEAGVVTVTLPEEEVKEWAESDEQIGIDGEFNDLKILIEKDFACPGRSDDPDNLDAFPNPEIVCT